MVCVLVSPPAILKHLRFLRTTGLELPGASWRCGKNSSLRAGRPGFWSTLLISPTNMFYCVPCSTVLGPKDPEMNKTDKADIKKIGKLI